MIQDAVRRHNSVPPITAAMGGKGEEASHNAAVVAAAAGAPSSAYVGSAAPAAADSSGVPAAFMTPTAKFKTVKPWKLIGTSGTDAHPTLPHGPEEPAAGSTPCPAAVPDAPGWSRIAGLAGSTEWFF